MWNMMGVVHMPIEDEYRKIYDNEVNRELKREIAIYEDETEINNYQPLSHNCKEKCVNKCDHQCYKSLGKLMRKNIVFYCYGEDEVVAKFNNGLFADLEKAIKEAY